MNQTGCYVEYIPCVKCKKNQVMIRKYYDKRLSEWVSTDCPICQECFQYNLKRRG